MTKKICSICNTASKKRITPTCGHFICKKCGIETIKSTLELGETDIQCPVNKCTGELTANNIQKIAPQALYDEYLETCLKTFIQNSEEFQFVECPNEQCKVRMEWLKLSSDEIKEIENTPISQKTDDGKFISMESWIDFNENRLRCRECNENFCAKCFHSPYHLGMTCSEFSEFQKSRKCRFCKSSLVGKKIAHVHSEVALRDCCSDQECIEKRELACTKIHKCSHYCGGVKDEHVCLPCLQEPCFEKNTDEIPNYPTQNCDEFCSICWIDDIGSEPSVLLECGHILHYRCVKKIMDNKWNTGHISFGFSQCPLCKVPMKHQLFSAQNAELDKLRNQILELGRKKLKEENETDDNKILSDVSSPYFKNPDLYILDKFSFYRCFKCEEPYYGGRIECGDANHVEVKPEELICRKCASTVRIICSNQEHEQYWIYKCRYCCHPAKWFCFGTTHFCTPCHDNVGQVRNMLPEELPKCVGGKECPVGGDHPPNGQEFVLSCQLCQEEYERDPAITKSVANFEKRRNRLARIFKGVELALVALNFLIFFIPLISLLPYFTIILSYFSILLLNVIFFCFRFGFGFLLMVKGRGKPNLVVFFWIIYIGLSIYIEVLLHTKQSLLFSLLHCLVFAIDLSFYIFRIFLFFRLYFIFLCKSNGNRIPIRGVPFILAQAVSAFCPFLADCFCKFAVIFEHSVMYFIWAMFIRYSSYPIRRLLFHAPKDDPSVFFRVFSFSMFYLAYLFYFKEIHFDLIKLSLQCLFVFRLVSLFILAAYFARIVRNLIIFSRVKFLLLVTLLFVFTESPCYYFSLTWGDLVVPFMELLTIQ